MCGGACSRSNREGVGGEKNAYKFVGILWVGGVREHVNISCHVIFLAACKQNAYKFVGILLVGGGLE